MKQAVQAYLFLSQRSIMIASLVATAVLTIVVWKVEAMIDPSGRGMIGLQLAYTAAQAREVLSSWSDGGADLYLSTAWIHYLYAVTMALLLSSAPGYFARRRSGFSPAAVPPLDVVFSMVPFAAGLSDWAVQSMTVLFLSGTYSSDTLLRALTVTSVAKWVLLGFCLLVLLRSYFTTRKEQRQARP